MHAPFAITDSDRALASSAHQLQRAAGTLQAHAGDRDAVPTHAIPLAARRRHESAECRGNCSTTPMLRRSAIRRMWWRISSQSQTSGSYLPLEPVDGLASGFSEMEPIDRLIVRYRPTGGDLQC